jgi:hypothetical protein
MSSTLAVLSPKPDLAPRDLIHRTRVASGKLTLCLAKWSILTSAEISTRNTDKSGVPMPIASANMEPQENVPGLTNGYQDIGGPQPKYPQSAKFTRADGTFDDVAVGTCPPLPVTSLTPFPYPNQSIQILLNGIAYPVRTNSYSYSTTNLPNHGTITNGKDINASQ